MKDRMALDDDGGALVARGHAAVGKDDLARTTDEAALHGRATDVKGHNEGAHARIQRVEGAEPSLTTLAHTKMTASLHYAHRRTWSGLTSVTRLIGTREVDQRSSTSSSAPSKWINEQSLVHRCT